MNLTTLVLMVVSAIPACSFLAAQTPESETVYYADAYADHYGVPRALVRAIITARVGMEPPCTFIQGCRRPDAIDASNGCGIWR